MKYQLYSSQKQSEMCDSDNTTVNNANNKRHETFSEQKPQQNKEFYF